MQYLHEIINCIVQIINQLWYFWIFTWMFLESSFFPFPSEIIMIPAWYLAYQGWMNLYLVIFIWILGSLSWAWLNYILASKLGRVFLEKLIKKEKVDKLEDFFAKHGHITTFTWRLIPWIRQYISFPAGLSKMDPLKFSVYTTLWAWIWVIVLVLLGYFIGQHQNLIHKYLKEITVITLILIVLIIWIYYYFNVKKKK